MIFRILKSQGKIRTTLMVRWQVRWGGTLDHLSMAYLLSNICSKNYWNRKTIVEIIVGGWVVSFFESQCRSSKSILKLLLASITTNVIRRRCGVYFGAVVQVRRPIDLLTYLLW